MYRLFKANMYKYFITLYRAYPKSFFIGGLMSMFFTLLFSSMLYNGLFGGEVDSSFVSITNTANYMGYIVVGAVLYEFMRSTLLNVSRSLITEKRIGTLEAIMLAPYNRAMYFLSYMVAQTIHTFGELLCAIPIFLIFRVEFQSFDLLSFAIILIATLYGFLGLSMLLANVMLYTRDTYISQNTLFSIMFIVCGITFPVDYLPSFAAALGRMLPLTHSLILFRGVLLGGTVLSDHWSSFISLLIQGTVYITIGMLLLGRVEKIALENIDG